MKLAEIKESTTDLLVPKTATLHKKGPATSKTAVFYNPVMEFSRDVSIVVLNNFIKKRSLKFLDGLAATGARGVRIANEIQGDFEIVINDHNPCAVDIIKKNIAQNNLENCSAENMKMNTLLSEEDFDYVDIDPFGSPVKFLDASIQSLRKNGMLAVTATDTASLYGAYTKACVRRYDSRPARTSYSKETGARILAGFCVRQAARYEVALTPILTFFADHYIRVHFEVNKGAGRADKVLKDVGFLLHNPKTGERRLESEIPPRVKGELFSGPLWTGDLHDKTYLKGIKISENLGTFKRLNKYLELWREEVLMPPYFFDLNEVSSLTKTQPFSLAGMIDAIKDLGFSGGRTHFSPTGFKTDAKIEDICRIVR